MAIKFVEQKVIPLGVAPSRENEMKLRIETCGRTAYKSEDKICEGSADRFFEMLKKAGHLSVLEHSNIALGFSDYIGRDIKYEFYPRGIHHPLDSWMAKTCVAGNVRAWLETLEHLKSGSQFIYEVFDYNLRTLYPTIFGPCIDEHYSYTPWRLPCRIITESEQLTAMSYGQLMDFPVFMFKITCDRGISHEIVRHRVFSFTQESTRYVNYGNSGVTLIRPKEYSIAHLPMPIYGSYEQSGIAYNHLLFADQKPQIARDVLPNLLKTEIVVSGRWSGWKHFIELRDSKAAHPRIRAIAQDIRKYFLNLGLEV